MNSIRKLVLMIRKKRLSAKESLCMAFCFVIVRLLMSLYTFI